MTDLPDFRKMKREDVEQRIGVLLTNEYQTPPKNHVRELIEYDDGHYRALFDPAYFILPEGQTEPTKSQWNNLKKKIKRHESRIFLFKEYGAMMQAGERLYYLDFGWFANSA